MDASTLVYATITRSAVDWVLKRSGPEPTKKFTRRNGMIVAVLVLLVAFSSPVVSHIQEMEQSYYHILGIPVNADARAIKKAYKTAAVKNHPDKLLHSGIDEETANAMFSRVRDAFDTLSNPTSKQVYDLFGPKGLKDYYGRASAEQVATSHGIQSAIFFVMAAVATYLLTFGRGKPAAREWSYTGLVLLLVLEVVMKIVHLDPFSALLPSVTPYEKLEILHIAYYGYMQGCNIIADATYVDIQAMNNMLLQGLAQRQGELIRAVREMQIAVEALSKRGGGSGSSSGAKLDTVTPDALRRRKKRTDNGPGSVASRKAAAAQAAGAGAGAGAAAGAVPGTAPVVVQQPKKSGFNPMAILFVCFIIYRMFFAGGESSSSDA